MFQISQWTYKVADQISKAMIDTSGCIDVTWPYSTAISTRRTSPASKEQNTTSSSLRWSFSGMVLSLTAIVSITSLG
jgi:hypothetical protein